MAAVMQQVAERTASATCWCSCWLRSWPLLSHNQNIARRCCYRLSGSWFMIGPR